MREHNEGAERPKARPGSKCAREPMEHNVRERRGQKPVPEHKHESTKARADGIKPRDRTDEMAIRLMDLLVRLPTDGSLFFSHVDETYAV